MPKAAPSGNVGGLYLCCRFVRTLSIDILRTAQDPTSIDTRKNRVSRPAAAAMTCVEASQQGCRYGRSKFNKHESNVNQHPPESLIASQLCVAQLIHGRTWCDAMPTSMSDNSVIRFKYLPTCYQRPRPERTTAFERV